MRSGLVRYAAIPVSPRRSIDAGVASAESTTTGMRGGARVAGQRGEDLGAVDVGEVEVEEDHVGPVQQSELDSRPAAHGGDELDVAARPGQDASDELEVGRAVLDVEDARGPDVPDVLRDGGRRLLRDRHARRCVGERKLHVERRPLPRRGVRDPDGPAHRLGEAAREREPEPGALDPRAVGIQPLEGEERLLGRGGVHPGARVDHDRAEPARGQLGEVRAHGSAVAVVLHGVDEQVQQHLLKPLRVREDVAVQTAVHVGGQLDVARPGERPHELERVGKRLAGVHRTRGQVLGAGLQARDLQHLVDECEEVFAGLEDVLDAGSTLGSQRLEGQELPEPDDRVQRRAQLVAHPGEELALGLVGPLGLPPRLALGGLRPGAVGDVGRYPAHRVRAAVLVAQGELDRQPPPSMTSVSGSSTSSGRPDVSTV